MFAMRRLLEIGVLPEPRPCQALDTTAQAHGIGFTELVRRPTTSARDLTAGELEIGVARLREELAKRRPSLILAVFAPPVRALLGYPRRGRVRLGLQDERFGETQVFRLPAMNTARGPAAEAWDELGRLWRADCAGAD